MSEQDKSILEKEFKHFTLRNFEEPTQCKDLSQVEFYIKELKSKMKEFKQQFGFIPKFAYHLLWEYTSLQNHMINSGMYPFKQKIN